MRLAAPLLGAILLVLVSTGCEGGAPVTITPIPAPGGGATSPKPSGQPGQPPSPTAASPVAARPTVAPTAASAPTAQPAGGGATDTITAREGLQAADTKARSTHADYKLYGVAGCNSPVSGAAEGSFDRNENLRDGRCVIWRYEYTRDYKPPTFEGYYRLLIWVSPKGVLNTKETLHDKQVAKRPKGLPADWRIDSLQVMQLTERQGGQDFRKSYPQWDGFSWSANKNAIVIARLETTDHLDMKVNKGKTISGSKNLLWNVSYTPLEDLIFVVDATTGEVLMKFAEPPPKS